MRSIFQSIKRLTVSNPKSTFRFIHPGPLFDQELELNLVRTFPGNPESEIVPFYRFRMQHAQTKQKIGSIDLRIGTTENILLYIGHIGYRVLPAFRGHHYAARSCRLLFPLAKQHGINPLWITCNPDNLASRKTCTQAGGILMEIIELPKNHELSLQGEHQKCRYCIRL
jgi:predicted acetyltransferase